MSPKAPKADGHCVAMSWPPFAVGTSRRLQAVGVLVCVCVCEAGPGAPGRLSPPFEGKKARRPRGPRSGRRKGVPVGPGRVRPPRKEASHKQQREAKGLPAGPGPGQRQAKRPTSKHETKRASRRPRAGCGRPENRGLAKDGRVGNLFGVCVCVYSFVVRCERGGMTAQNCP